jgi:hypothetical protein
LILVHIILKLGQLNYILKLTFITSISIKRTSCSTVATEAAEGGRNCYHTLTLTHTHTHTHGAFLNILHGALNIFYIEVFTILKNYFSLTFKFRIILSSAHNKHKSIYWKQDERNKTKSGTLHYSILYALT